MINRWETQSLPTCSPQPQTSQSTGDWGGTQNYFLKNEEITKNYDWGDPNITVYMWQRGESKYKFKQQQTNWKDCDIVQS